MPKCSTFDKVGFVFCLKFEKDEDYSEALQEMKPKSIITLQDSVLFFIESDTSIMKNNGVLIPNRFVPRFNVVAVIPQPEYHPIDGIRVVEFSAFVKSDTLETIIIQNTDNELIRDHIQFEIGVDDLEVLFLNLTGVQPKNSKNNEVVVLVDKDIKACIFESEDSEDEKGRIFYMRCPARQKTLKTKQFDKQAIELFNRKCQ